MGRVPPNNRHGKHWTQGEIEALRRRYPAEGPEALAHTLGRTPRAVVAKAAALQVRYDFSSDAPDLIVGANGTAFVPLTGSGHGQYAVVDQEDIPLVEGYRWFRSSEGYPTTRMGTRPKTMHRHLMGCEPEAIDHADRNPLNNTRSNLRACTHADNARNSASYGAVPYKGVSKRRANLQKPYVATITADGTKHHLGMHATAEEAARAYDHAARRLFGQFAYLNFP